MLTTFSDNSLFIMPLCFHPTTIMLVDDNPNFLKQLSDQLNDYVPTLTFTEPDKAIDYFEHKKNFLFRSRLLEQERKKGLISAIRNELYNADRFKVIIISVIDYDMPDKTGFDIIKTMTSSLPNEMSFHSYILLTGKRFSEFDKQLADSEIGKNFISKWDPNLMNPLIWGHKKDESRSFAAAVDSQNFASSYAALLE
jgi:CheY-like chemotaxis protein